MPETILSVLTQGNPTPNPWHVGPAPNTVGREWLGFGNWTTWKEFKYNKLRSIYNEITDAPWKNRPATIEWSLLDLTYGNEDGLEQQILSRETILTVNSALSHAQAVCGQPGQLHLGRRGRCTANEDARLKPDWTLVRSDAVLPDGYYANIMPGDTKLSARWTPFDTSNIQWKLPVQQVLTYSNDVQCRYGFVITDSDLVVCALRESM